jgi:hypothetical protein
MNPRFTRAASDIREAFFIAKCMTYPSKIVLSGADARAVT